MFKLKDLLELEEVIYKILPSFSIYEKITQAEIDFLTRKFNDKFRCMSIEQGIYEIKPTLFMNYLDNTLNISIEWEVVWFLLKD